MLYIHESKIIPEDLSWDESSEFLRKYLSEHPEVHYYAAPACSFNLEEAGAVALQKGCNTVVYDNLS